MDDSTAFSVFVGDLAPEVNDFLLQESFRQFYSTVRSAKVITDPATGRSKGFGFVRFASEAERDRALEMQGFNLGGRPIRVSLATARRAAGSGNANAVANAAPHPADLDPSNTTLFIGGLSAGVPEDQLRAIFGRFGDIVYVKIPAGKGCGFVQFVERPGAELAMASLNGQIIGANAIRISWGRSTSRAPAARDATAVVGAGYGGGGPVPGAAFSHQPFPAAGAFGGFGGGAGYPGAPGMPGGGFAGAPAGYGGGGLPYGAGGAAAGMGGVDGPPGGGAAGGFPQGFAGGGFGLPGSMQQGAPGGAGLGILGGGPGGGANAAAAALSNGHHPASVHHQQMQSHIGALGAAAGGPAGGGLPLANGGGGGAPYDPTNAGSADVAAMNAAYMARQQQALLGGAGGFLLPRQ